jgi:hypothetical protein
MEQHNSQSEVEAELIARAKAQFGKSNFNASPA